MRLCFWEVLKDGEGVKPQLVGSSPSRGGQELPGVLAGQGCRPGPPRAAFSV